MKQSRKKASAGSWMDTYGDMVTLLLCFFVLLYAISSMDQSKRENLVASMNPEAAEQLEEMRSQEAVEAEEITESLQTMYENLVNEFHTMGLDANVTVVRGDGYNFISFSEEVFFEGDSYYVTDNGKRVLDGFGRAIAPAADQVHEIQVLGHTTEVPNRFEHLEDRMLSTGRAAQVTAYIQALNLIEPGRLVSLGFGQFRPIADMNTEEGRQMNRRVEILITSDDAVMKSLTEYYAEVYGEDVAAMQPDADLFQPDADAQSQETENGGDGA